MRVTGGALAGRRLRAPRGSAVRPSSDRVREALFARLGDLSGAAVLDLFAGTGALGIEALSRGAAEATFVERAAPALACLEANLAELGLSSQGRILPGEVAAVLRRLGRQPVRFDLVLLDPPYASGEAEAVLGALLAGDLLRPEATVVVETGHRHPVGAVPGLALLDERRYGDTLIGRFAPVDPAGAGAGTGGRGSE